MTVYKEIAEDLQKLLQINEDMVRLYAHDIPIFGKEECECYDCEMERAEERALNNAEQAATGN
jgi:hypothetical protein